MKINSKNTAIVLLVLAGVLLLGGIALLLFLVPGAATFFKVCLVIISILFILMGLGLLYVLYLGRDNNANFFLYDTKTQCNIPVEELSFDRVNSRMSYFLTTLSTSQEKLWADNVLADNGTGRFGINDVYRPLGLGSVPLRQPRYHRRPPRRAGGERRGGYVQGSQPRLQLRLGP